MSTDQHAWPRCENQSIADESARPGTVRSNVGCDAIEEPCTNSTAGFPSGVPAYFSHRNRRTAPLFVQCSLPVTVIISSIDLCAGFLDDFRPAIFFSVKERSEFGGRRPDDFNSSSVHVTLSRSVGELIDHFSDE